MQKESIFGSDVRIFRPERFLEASGDKRVAMERAMDIVFGGDRWVCAGKLVAMMELNKTFFEVSFSYNMAALEGAWWILR